MKRTKVLCEKRDLESIEIRGVELRPGSRVLLNPHGWLEILDRALKDKVAVVESIAQDFEERLFVAVIVEGVPSSVTDDGGKTCNRFFVRPDEIELLDRPRQTG
jgi:hypothetical protein